MFKKKEIKRKFKPYIENEVKSVLGNTDKRRVVSEKKNATVLFSRIHSFTNYLVNYSPEEVISNLSEYLTEMVNVILSSGGIVKHVGDDIMAVFGPPDRVPDHAERACLTALEMSRSP